MNAVEEARCKRAFLGLYRAWCSRDRQLSFDGFWPDSGLDETELSALGLVEPAVFPHASPGGGLDIGAEPCCGTPSELTAQSQSLHGPARITSGGSALPNTTGPDANPPRFQRPAQEVTV